MRIILVFVSSYMALFGLTLSESMELALSNSPKVSISKSIPPQIVKTTFSKI
ncbi:MAG: hypothetical protein GQ570_12185 [Helicobacteraceae bacterium]|nr:hypothetical protein [Helicobacteraceae bacterium]